MNIVYFSHTGHSKKVAQMISDEIMEPILELVPVDPYPLECESIAKEEISNGTFKELKDIELKNGEDTILIFPSWYRTVPPVVTSFLKKYKPSKVIAVILSYEGDPGVCPMVLNSICNLRKIIAVKNGNESYVVKRLADENII